MPVSPERFGFTPEVDKTEEGELLVWKKTSEVPSNLQENVEATRRFEESFLVLQERLERRARRINEVLRRYNLGPEFEPGELLFNPITGHPEIDPDVNVLYVTADRSHGRDVLGYRNPIFVDPMDLGATFEEFRNEGKHVEVLNPFSDLGRGGVAITFPANLGPKVPGGKEEHTLLSLVFERKGEHQEPLIVIGNGEVLENQISKITQPFEHVIFDNNEYLKLNERIFGFIPEVERVTQSPFPRIAGKLQEFQGTVEKVSVNIQNAGFYTFVTLDLKNGERIGFWMTPGEEYEGGRIRQGSASVILHEDSSGEPIVAFVSQRRYSGNIQAIELPRGFRQGIEEASEETGIPVEELKRYQTSAFLVPEDPIRANVEFEFILVEIPKERRFNLQELTKEAEAQKRPGALLEELTPSWMRLRDMVESAVEGNYVTDAHTISSLFTALLIKGAVIKADEVKQFGIVLEKFQNFRDGSVRLGIPRGNSQRMDETLRGELNPNSGPCRIWNKIGFATHGAGLPKGSYEVKGLNEILRDIKGGKVDIVTTSAVFKTLMQKGLIAIDYSKI